MFNLDIRKIPFPKIGQIKKICKELFDIFHVSELKTKESLWRRLFVNKLQYTHTYTYATTYVAVGGFSQLKNIELSGSK